MRLLLWGEAVEDLANCSVLEAVFGWIYLDEVDVVAYHEVDGLNAGNAVVKVITLSCDTANSGRCDIVRVDIVWADRNCFVAKLVVPCFVVSAIFCDANLYIMIICALPRCF